MEDSTQFTLPKIARRDFLGTAIARFPGLAVAAPVKPPVVSVVRIKKDNIGAAVEHAMDLLGGVETVTKGKERIMLKPSLVFPSRDRHLGEPQQPGDENLLSVFRQAARNIQVIHE